MERIVFKKYSLPSRRQSYQRHRPPASPGAGGNSEETTASSHGLRRKSRKLPTSYRYYCALTGVAHLVGCRPAKQKVRLLARARAWVAGPQVGAPTTGGRLKFLSLSPSLFLSVKINKN